MSLQHLAALIAISAFCSLLGCQARQAPTLPFKPRLPEYSRATTWVAVALNEPGNNGRAGFLVPVPGGNPRDLSTREILRTGIFFRHDADLCWLLETLRPKQLVEFRGLEEHMAEHNRPLFNSRPKPDCSRLAKEEQDQVNQRVPTFVHKGAIVYRLGKFDDAVQPGIVLPDTNHPYRPGDILNVAVYFRSIEERKLLFDGEVHDNPVILMPGPRSRLSAGSVLLLWPEDVGLPYPKP